MQASHWSHPNVNQGQDRRTCALPRSAGHERGDRLDQPVLLLRSYKGWGRQMHGQQVQVQQAWATL